jgi:hypothetical protein
MPEYRYELRRGDEVVATGHLSREEPLVVGQRVTIGVEIGIIRSLDPLLYKRELRLVVQLLRDAESVRNSRSRADEHKHARLAFMPMPGLQCDL